MSLLVIPIISCPILKSGFSSHKFSSSFKIGFMKMDIDSNSSAIVYSPPTTLPLDMTVSTVALIPSGVPPGTGESYYLLLVEFFQEVNGVLYALNDGNFNSLTLLEVH